MKFQSRREAQSGQTLVEYGLIVALVSLVVVALIVLLIMGVFILGFWPAITIYLILLLLANGLGMFIFKTTKGDAKSNPGKGNSPGGNPDSGTPS